MKLHHLALGARDVSMVAAWYARVFELPEIARHHYDDGELRSVWLDLRGTVLMVEHTEEAIRTDAGRVDGVGAGPFLLAFEIDASERGAFEERLEAEGATIEDRTSYTSYTRDPEGNRVAVSCYPVR
jgi:catechol 2,3-dioxygenase-like lactoylglutathione lyase family enzyme